MITSITVENFKGVSGTEELTGFDIFLGPSGSGKSTWLEAMCIGIQGYHPVTGKLPSATMAFASGNPMSIELKVNEEAGYHTVKRVFTKKGEKCTKEVYLNGELLKQSEVDEALIPILGDLTTMFNLEEFVRLSDDKKMDFLFEKSSLDEITKVGMERRCILAILSAVTDSVPYVLEYKFDNKDPLDMDAKEWKSLLKAIGEKIEVEANKDAVRGIIAEQINSSTATTGQDVLSQTVTSLNDEINAQRRLLQDSKKANTALIDQKHSLELPGGTALQVSKKIEALTEEIQAIQVDLQVAEKSAESDKLQSEAIRSTENLIIQNNHQIAELEKKVAELFPGRDSLASLDAEQDDILLKEFEALAESREIHKKDLAVLIETSKQLQVKYKGPRDELIKLEAKKESVTRHTCPDCKSTLTSSCPDCGQTWDSSSYQKALLELDDDIVTLNEECAKNDEAFSANSLEIKEVEEKVAEFDKLLLDISGFIGRVGTAKVDLASKRIVLSELEKNLVSQKEAYKSEGVTDDIETMRDKIAGLTVTREALKTSLSSFDRFKALEISIGQSVNRISTCEASIEILKKADEAIKGLRNSVTDELLVPLEEIANTLLEPLGKNLKLSYEIEGSNFEIRCVNLNGIKVNFNTLSGGEKVIYSCAQLAAILHMARPPVKIIQVELGELSGELVPGLMEGLKDVSAGEIQILASSCHTDFSSVFDPVWTLHYKKN